MDRMKKWLHPVLLTLDGSRSPVPPALREALQELDRPEKGRGAADAGRTVTF